MTIEKKVLLKVVIKVAKVSNETKLVVALLKEKAKAKKDWSARTKARDDEFRDGIDWVLETLDKIIAETDQPPW